MKSYESDLQTLYKDVILEYLEAYILNPHSVDIYENISKKIKMSSVVCRLAKEPYWVKWFVTVKLIPAMKRLNIDCDTLINSLSIKLDIVIEELQKKLQPIDSIDSEVILDCYLLHKHNVHHHLNVDAYDYEKFMKKVDGIFKPKTRTCLRELNPANIRKIAKIMDSKRFAKETKERSFFANNIHLLQPSMTQKSTYKLLEDFFQEKQQLREQGGFNNKQDNALQFDLTDEALDKLLQDPNNLEDREQILDLNTNFNANPQEALQEQGDCVNSEQINIMQFDISDENLHKLLQDPNNLELNPNEKVFQTNISQASQCFVQPTDSSNFGLYSPPSQGMTQLKEGPLSKKQKLR